MSAPAPAAPAADAESNVGRKKKLLVIAAAVLLLLAAAGGGGAWWWKSKQAAAERALAEQQEQDGADEAEGAEAGRPAKGKPAKERRVGPPVFVALDPFTINLADRDAERYAQVGITLEVDDPKTGEQVKQFMPAVRNNILLALADKTAAELHARDGKQRLAAEIASETSRVIGGTPQEPPVRAVHFSNFIIQ